ncbi:MAG: translesion error-prone DNA polymerase V autoproteolytic subunit [Cyanobacteria bacterium SID2]|nr:translesion error-prone DNA polymerase V autoproteolytic subunit [Cyanobacteria bacterium SID2]MBP0003958.1 translesion error-prone DNA polymerase V autoproteolytic subunit [Cyanobacteria bacterium SBC]
MTRGGKRLGAGRPPGTGKYGEPTKAMRLPVSLAEQLTDLLSDWQNTKAHGISKHVQRLRQSFASPFRLPLYSDAVAAGFPAPATDYVDRELDLNEYLTPHPDASFCVRANGDSMIDAGIHPGDLLVVDTVLEAQDEDVVIAVVDGELTVKRIRWKNESLWLVPENANYQPFRVTEEMNFRVLGVVTNVVHRL